MFNEMNYIYAVYEERSFSKAAKKLFVSQPALSSMVKKVEEKIGHLIFDRNTIPLTVTKEGEYYIKCIENILSIEKNMQSYFDDLKNLNSGSLVLGGSSFFIAFILPKLLEKFMEKFPKVKIETIEGNLNELKEGLENNTIDVIIETGISEKDESIRTFIYGEETILLSVPSKWEINEKLKAHQLTSEDVKKNKHLSEEIKEISLSHFKELPFINMKKGNDQYSRGRAMCKKAGIVPKSIYQIDQILTGYHIAESTGSGALFVRDSLVKREQPTDKLVYYKLDKELSKRNIYLGIKKDRYITTAMREFLKLACPNEVILKEVKDTKRSKKKNQA